MDNEVKAAILKLLASPKSYSVDGESITAQSPDDLKKLMKLLAEAEDAGDPLKRCRLFKVSTQEAAR